MIMPIRQRVSIMDNIPSWLIALIVSGFGVALTAKINQYKLLDLEKKISALQTKIDNAISAKDPNMERTIKDISMTAAKEVCNNIAKPIAEKTINDKLGGFDPEDLKRKVTAIIKWIMDYRKNGK